MLKGWGTASLFVGVFLVGISFFLPTTVSTDVPSVIGGYGFTTAREVINIGKLQTQMLVFGTGATLFLAGTIMIGTGEIAERVAEIRNGSESPPAAETVAEVVEAPPNAPLATTIDVLEGEEADRAMYKILGGVVAAIFIFVVIVLATFGGKPTPALSTQSNEAVDVMGGMDAVADNMTGAR